MSHGTAAGNQEQATRIKELEDSLAKWETHLQGVESRIGGRSSSRKHKPRRAQTFAAQPSGLSQYTTIHDLTSSNNSRGAGGVNDTVASLASTAVGGTGSADWPPPESQSTPATSNRFNERQPVSNMSSSHHTAAQPIPQYQPAPGTAANVAQFGFFTPFGGNQGDLNASFTSQRSAQDAPYQSSPGRPVVNLGPGDGASNLNATEEMIAQQRGEYQKLDSRYDDLISRNRELVEQQRSQQDQIQKLLDITSTLTHGDLPSGNRNRTGVTFADNSMDRTSLGIPPRPPLSETVNAIRHSTGLNASMTSNPEPAQSSHLLDSLSGALDNLQRLYSTITTAAVSANNVINPGANSSVAPLGQTMHGGMTNMSMNAGDQSMTAPSPAKQTITFGPSGNVTSISNNVGTPGVGLENTMVNTSAAGDVTLGGQPAGYQTQHVPVMQPIAVPRPMYAPAPIGMPQTPMYASGPTPPTMPVPAPGGQVPGYVYNPYQPGGYAPYGYMMPQGQQVPGYPPQQYGQQQQQQQPQQQQQQPVPPKTPTTIPTSVPRATSPIGVGGAASPERVETFQNEFYRALVAAGLPEKDAREVAAASSPSPRKGGAHSPHHRGPGSPQAAAVAAQGSPKAMRSSTTNEERVSVMITPGDGQVHNISVTQSELNELLRRRDQSVTPYPSANDPTHTLERLSREASEAEAERKAQREEDAAAEAERRHAAEDSAADTTAPGTMSHGGRPPRSASRSRNQRGSSKEALARYRSAVKHGHSTNASSIWEYDLGSDPFPNTIDNRVHSTSVLVDRSGLDFKVPHTPPKRRPFSEMYHMAHKGKNSHALQWEMSLRSRDAPKHGVKPHF